MSKMKYSGVEWIGDIPNEWNLKRIKYNLLQPITDGPHETPVFIDNGIPFLSVDSIQNNKLLLGNRYISIEDAKTYDKKCKPQYGDILMGKAASIGKIAIVDIKEYFQIWSPLALIRPDNDKLFNKFLMYYLESSSGQEYIENFSTKNTQKNIAMEDIEKIKIIIPNVLEQKLISSFLDQKVNELDKVINDLNMQIEILDNYKSTMIYETVTKGLNKGTEYKKTNTKWIDKIPKNWSIKRFRYLLKEIKVGPFGSSLSGDDIKTFGDYWVYNQRTVLDNNFSSNDTFIDKEKFNELKNFQVKTGDLLLTTRGTIGKLAIVPENCKKGILHPCLIRFTVDEQLMNPKLLQLIFNNTSMIQEQLNCKSNSTTIDVIYSYNLKDIYVPIIPLDEQQEIVKYLDKKCEQIDKIIEDKQKQIEKIEEYKKSVIYEYVTGKKRVEGAEELYG